ncbi:MAG TPA: hypothetical protein VIV61_19550 [Candidatus Ozemobacteraceae bacterium]
MGAIDIHLPSSAQPQLELDTKLGHIDNGFGHCTPAADAPRIRAVTSMGSIGVSRLDDGEEEEETKELPAEAPVN